MAHIPNLQHSMVQDYWTSRDARLGSIMAKMEAMEQPWVLDSEPEVAAALERLMRAVNAASPDTLNRHLGEFIRVLGYIGSPKAFRILQWLDDLHGPHPSPANLLVSITRESQALRQTPDAPEANLLMERLQVLKSLSILSKVFCPQRVRVLGSILHNDEDPGDRYS